jgi:hypothetical protein
VVGVVVQVRRRVVMQMTTMSTKMKAVERGSRGRGRGRVELVMGCKIGIGDQLIE